MALVFGTDGVRGHFGSEIDEEKIISLGIAASKHLNVKRVYLGRDTRESSFVLASALKQGLNHGGVEVISLGVAPTPEVAHVAKLENAGGAVISASHNSWSDNGVKLFGPGGLKISDSVQDLIQTDWDNEQRERQVVETPELQDVNDHRWIKSVISSAKQGCFSGLKIVVDCANGATVNKAATIFKELGATVLEISSNPDGRNINDGCGSNNPQNLIKEVLSSGSDIGFAFDGDGDRVGVVDEKGNEIFSDKIGLLIARHLSDQYKNSKFIVDVKSTGLFGRDKKLAANSCKTTYWKTGHSYIKRKVNEEKALAGFEKSGHFFFNKPLGLGYDDGILSAIQVCKMLDRKIPKKMSDLLNELPTTYQSPTMAPYCADEVKYEVVKIITEKFKALLKNKHRISEKLITEILTVNGIRFTLDDGSWGLIRASSNKPSLVIVTESVQSKMDMKAIFNFIDKLLKETGKVGSYDQKI